jgi:glycosyltransferase involved in cell wall biosynthesis/SAM-dependent methyltransferase
MKYSLQTDKPVAIDSPDHLAPRGTKNDNSRNRLFNRKLEALFIRRPLRILDVGCAGGGFVKDCLDDGHHAVGLEGSDYSKMARRAEWATIPDHLFTCDITVPFILRAPDSTAALFDAITGWELMEHIRTEDVSKVVDNLLAHLAPGGVLVFSIADFPDADGGVNYHQTVRPREWWIDTFAALGLAHHPALVDYFRHDWIRGPYQGSQSFHVVLTRSAEAVPSIPATNPCNGGDLLGVATAFLQSGVEGKNTGGATRHLDYSLMCYDALLKFDANVAAQAGRATCLMHLGRRAEAAAVARQLLETHPENQTVTQIASQIIGAAPTPPAVRPSAGLNNVRIDSAGGSRAHYTLPLISIVTPAYNCARYLKECIESVLNQGYPNVEHIIADGGSTDGTVELLKQYPHLKWISEKDGGEAEALNKALRMSSGQIINWLNADDAYVGQGVLHAAAEAFNLHSDADVIYGKALVVNDSGDIVNFDPPRAPLDLLNLMRWFHDVHLMQPSIFYRRRVHEKVGFYREDLYFSIDYDYWLRTAAAGFQFHYIDRTLSMSRLIREGAKSAAPRILQEKNWQEIAASYAPMLDIGQRYTFWKDYYAWRLANAQRYNESLETPPDAQALTALAETMLSTGQLPTALKVIQDYLNRHPQDSDAHYLAAQALTKAGQVDKARAIAGKGVALEAQRAIEAPRDHALSLPSTRLPVTPVSQDERADDLKAAVSAFPAPSKQALIFFPHNPLPVATGAHQRCLTVMHALRQLGYRVDLFSSTLSTDQPWTGDSFQKLRKAGFGVHLHETSAGDLQYQRQIDAAGTKAAFGQRAVTPNMKQHFRQIFDASQPDLVMVNYAHFGDLARSQAFAAATTAIDMLDLVSANEGMRMRLWKDWGNRWTHQFSVADVPMETLDESYFSEGSVEADPAEYAMYNDYHRTLAIAAREADLIARNAPDTRVALVPAVYEPTALNNSYDSDPVFLIGTNLFNAQGYLYFAARVAPRVLQSVPQFNLRVAGGGCKMVRPEPGMSPLGFVPQIDPMYATAPFAICPLIGGTGQQIKVIEAMSRAVPVICLKNVAHSSPIEHGINGYIAANAEEFACYVQKLWSDRSLCRKLGQAARETVANQFTQEMLVTNLESALSIGSLKISMAA